MVVFPQTKKGGPPAILGRVRKRQSVCATTATRSFEREENRNTPADNNRETNQIPCDVPHGAFFSFKERRKPEGFTRLYVIVDSPFGGF